MTTTRRTPNPEDFWKFTDEEMETAKGTDLPDLLEHLGYTIRRLGSRYHTTREMDSIRIKDWRTWKRYSNGKGGDAISSSQSPLYSVSACGGARDTELATTQSGRCQMIHYPG